MATPLQAEPRVAEGDASDRVREVTVALQGTLETFSVPEVLRLLASTRKTGLLAIGGDRGTGQTWLVDGELVGAESENEPAGDVTAVLFDLLRFAFGEFVFEAGTTSADPGPPLDVEATLARAETLLAEWSELTAVIPSLDTPIRLVPELADPVTVSPEQWYAVVAVGDGTTAGAIGRHCGLGELDTYRRVRDLVAAGLVDIDDPTRTRTRSNGHGHLEADEIGADESLDDFFAPESASGDEEINRNLLLKFLSSTKG